MEGLSLVIPIYNVELYLEKCLLSIAESMPLPNNIQVILVDDGSTDQSGEIAEKFAEEHTGFEFYRKTNGGLSDARNYGIPYALYDYVSFIDSDDLIEKQYFDKVLTALQERPDLVIFDWIDVQDGHKPVIISGMDFEDVLWSTQPSAWNKVFKKSLFNNIQFPVGKVYEDVGTIYKLLYFVENYIYINEPLYKYRKNRKGSILTTVSPKINDLYSALDDTYNFYRSKDEFSQEQQDGLCYQHVKLLVWSNMYRQLKFYKFNFLGFHRKMEMTRELLYRRFPEWKNNNHLNRNAPYFESRLGNNYISQLDQIGVSPFSTFKTLSYAIAKNRKR